jgi:hypothetical protein
MAAMRRSADYDPILRSQREAPSFNAAWFKHGEKLNLLQRIGFLVFSLTSFRAGLFIERLAVGFVHGLDLISMDTVFVGVGLLVGLFFLA